MLSLIEEDEEILMQFQQNFWLSFQISAKSHHFIFIPDDDSNNLQNCLIQTLAEVDQSASIGSHSAQHYSWIEEKNTTYIVNRIVSYNNSDQQYKLINILFLYLPPGSTTYI